MSIIGRLSVFICDSGSPFFLIPKSFDFLREYGYYSTAAYCRCGGFIRRIIRLRGLSQGKFVRNQTEQLAGTDYSIMQVTAADFFAFICVDIYSVQ